MRFNGSAAVPLTTPPEPGGGEYFVWQPPNRSITVRIRPEVLAEIGRQCTGPAAQVGGLLLGNVRFAGRHVVSIESFEAIEERFWKRYPQAHDDPARLRLETALARWRSAPDRPLAAVGYYRIEESGALLGPSNSDLMLIARYFAAPHNVFLFVRPGSGARPATGGFACWQYGQIPETVDLEFSLSDGTAARGGAAPALGQEGDEFEPPPSGVAGFLRGRGWSASARLRLWWLGAAGILVLILLGLGAASWMNLQRKAPAAVPVQASRLSLTAERSGLDYRITWDRNSPAVTLASKGALLISDGDFRRVIDLDAVQLKGGSLLYTPLTGDALIQLEVSGNGPKVTESVRVLSPLLSSVDSALPPPLIIKPAPAQPMQPRGPQERSLAPSRGFTPPAAASREDTAGVPAPPSLGSDATVQWTTLPAPVPSQAPPPQPQVQREAPTRAEQPPPRVSDYRPPRPLQQPRPVLNSLARQALISKGGGPAKVDVAIVIGASGKVTQVQPYSGRDLSERRLWDVAAEAARAWTFEPARLNGQAIESSMTLSFQFVGTGSK